MGVYLNFGLLTHKFTHTVVEGISIYVVFYFYFVSTSLAYITIKTSVCPVKGNIWILKSWKFFACKLCNPESQALDSSIQLKVFLLVIGIQNPSSTDKESGIQLLESRATTDSTIQDRLGLPHTTRWFPSTWGGGGEGGGLHSYKQGLYRFLNKKFK